MSEYNVYLQVPDYLAQWISHTFGSPVQLGRDSPENRIMNEMLTKLPNDSQPDTEANHNVIIPIPFFKGKDPRVYNYLYPSGKSALIESFKTLLKKNILEEVGSLEKHGLNCNISSIIYAFMEKHGIDQKHWDTVSQIYFRSRKRYFQKNDIKI